MLLPALMYACSFPIASKKLFSMQEVHVVEEIKTEEDKPKRQSSIEKLKLKRRLIALVAKQDALYDARHHRFFDDSYKNELWQDIAQELSLDLTECLSTWAKVRYKYQNHVRCLRNYRRTIGQNSGAKRRRRPVMILEEDLMFLYEHVAKLKLKPQRLPKIRVESLEKDSLESAGEIIDVDLFADEDVSKFPCINEYRRLIEAVKPYPQLYDVDHTDYNNYRHRGLIWLAISNELRDRATKLMKLWLYLQTRYEWELISTGDRLQHSELGHMLSFLGPHVIRNPSTVCKSSLYLQNDWFDPIQNFPTILILIDTIKGLPELVQFVQSNVSPSKKGPRYHVLWMKVASLVKSSCQSCEVTWLTFHCLFQELSEMRKCGYLLKDKWYFEDVIGSMNEQILPSPLPFAIVYPPTAKTKIDSNSNPNTTSSSVLVRSTSSISSPLVYKQATSLTTSLASPNLPSLGTASTRNGNQVTVRILQCSSSVASSALLVPSAKETKLVGNTILHNKVSVIKLNPTSVKIATTTLSSARPLPILSLNVPLKKNHESALNIRSNTAAPAATEKTPNDLKVELVENLDKASSLHVWSKTLAFHYQLSMGCTALFIREIMAIPQLHSKNPQLLSKNCDFWQQISDKFHVPEAACRACWSFLVKNMSLFPHIAPMSDLMCPIGPNNKIWQKSHYLFSELNEIASKNQWIKHKDKLPALLQHFGHYDHLYCDLRKPRPGESLRTPHKCSEQERQAIWRSVSEKFPNMNCREICLTFKSTFLTYMEDLERGVENPWPQDWWQSLEQLKFLVSVRYHPLEPFYYIVHRKFQEEVIRCNLHELLKSDLMDKENAIQSNTSERFIMPWESKEAKRLLTGRLIATSLSSTKDRDWPPLSLPEIHGPVPPTSKNSMRHAQGPSGILPTISPFQLTRELLNYPYTFRGASTMKQRAAWVRVANNLYTTVRECRLSLQHAIRQQRILSVLDPECRCLLNQKYYCHMREIYSQMSPEGTPPTDLNRPLPDTGVPIYPEHYIPEINMMTCKPRLVLKNLTFAMENFSSSVQEELQLKLAQIFTRYAEEARLNWPMKAPIEHLNNVTND
ncbi:uncharacterized protein LOC111519606 isoform X1 [Drosophila willistoni]|uniref:uncharacterized protein LOC111519606 isoform X1 n=1 Tax=Drosophila willistoni TaxID=7260 RepID=UPI001F083693|nr:uncharacterized protein LOC111519606 isoform X1 [Drosophila willistoni]